MRRMHARLGSLFAVGALICAGAASSSAQTENVIHRFTRTTTDGGTPASGLIADMTGNLYGTTAWGGAFDQGTVFKLSPPAVAGGAWTQTILYSFTGGTDGARPQGQLVFDKTGNLYGTTVYGGDPDLGEGVVFELSPPAISGDAWTETVLWAFGSGIGMDGAFATGNLVFDASGNLYGATSGGGAASIDCGESNCGTVFQLKPPTTPGGAWTESDIYNFFSVGTTDGISPTGILLNAGGVLYGTTNGGGTSGLGTMFKLTPPATSGGSWTEKVLFSFSGGTSGSFPTSVVQGKKGVLYGATSFGGTSNLGTVFALNPPTPGTGWTESVLYNFAGGAGDGALPGAGLAIDAAGNLYGTTTAGGSTACGRSNGCGTVFELKPPAISGGAWTESVLHSFTGGRDGFLPSFSPVLQQRGLLFGTTLGGGTTADYGVVYRVMP